MTRRRKKHRPEEVVAKLRDADAMLNAGKDLAAVLQALEVSVTSSPFLDPFGMLGFLTLASPERADFLDGEEELFGGTDRVRFAAG